MINKAIIIGNVGNDPKFTEFTEGCALEFSVATSEKYTDKATGEVKELTEWHSVVLSNKIAKALQPYIKKGGKVYVEGKIKTRSWEGQDGQKRYKTEIRVGMDGKVKLLYKAENVENSPVSASNTVHLAEVVHPQEYDNDTLPF